jgi:FkbM family methyltransferase
LAHLLCQTRYFVEFGACDGVEGSNTLLLERRGWRGVLAEPGKSWLAGLSANRNCLIVNKAIGSKSGETLMFSDTKNPVYSTLSSFRNNDLHSEVRQGAIEYPVVTISLNDLLMEADAPTKIGYLSIDTEGSEYEILKTLNFEKYSFELITVEHNFTSNEFLIEELLTKHGYLRILREISGGDSWYIAAEVK